MIKSDSVLIQMKMFKKISRELWFKTTRRLKTKKRFANANLFFKFNRAK